MAERAAIYTRVSTEKQAEKYSLPAQRRILRESAEQRGWEVVAEYEDAGISGETIEDRPDFTALLAEARIGKFEYLLTIDTDRLSRSRDLRTLADIQDALIEGGVQIATPSQILDPRDEEDVFLTGLFGLLAAREKAKLVRRMTRGMEEAVRQGRRMGCSRDPYGFTYVPSERRLHVNPEEAPIVRICFELYLEGWSQGRIARELELRGHTPRNTNRFVSEQIGQILRNPVHAGYAVWRKSRNGRRLVRGDRRDWVWPEAPTHVAIVDLATWEKAQTERARRIRSRKPRNYGESDYLLSGLIRCFCDHRMQGHSNRKQLSGGRTGRRRYYRCAGYRRGNAPHPLCPSEAVEAAVLEKVSLLGRCPDFLEQARRRALLDRMRSGTQQGKELDDLRRQLDALRRKQDTLYEDRLEERISERQWERFNERLLVEEADLEARMERAENDLLSDPRGPERASRVIEILSNFPRVFATLDALPKKRLLRAIVSRVKIREDKDQPPDITFLEPWASLLDLSGTKPAVRDVSESA